MWSSETKATKYLPVRHHRDAELPSDPENELGGDDPPLGRYFATGPLPAICDCILDDSRNKVMESCIVGGVHRKLQQFGRRQQMAEGPKRDLAILLGAYLLYLYGLDRFLEEREALRVTLSIFPLVVIVLGARLGISQDHRSKMELQVQEISEQLQPLGLVLRVEETPGMCIELRKKKSQPLHQLPPVALEFQKSIPPKDSKMSVDSLLYYNNNDALPVDDWIAGGLALRLRVDRHKASRCSRWSARFVLLALGAVSIGHWAARNRVVVVPNAPAALADSTASSMLHGALVALSIAGCLTVAYCYLRECLDASAIHGASRAVVKQFSAVTKERHNLALHYEVQPGDFLPRTTKGVIRFHRPTSDGGGATDLPKKKAKASVAFV